MRIQHKRIALIPYHCPYCNNYVWLKEYKKADLPVNENGKFRKMKICKGCLHKLNMEFVLRLAKS